MLLFPAELWAFIEACGWSWGWLNLRADHTEGVVTISHVWKGDSVASAIDQTRWQRAHYLHYADLVPFSAVWYRADPELHAIHAHVSRRLNASLRIEEFQRHIKTTGWVHATHEQPLPVVAVSTEDSGGAGVSAWRVTPDGAAPEPVSVVDDVARPADFVAGVWPVEELATCRVTVVGVGSIGSVAAETLAVAGVGELCLVDPDRLEQRNLARHRLPARHLGRFKVRAMREHLENMDVVSKVVPYPIDVITETDVLRPLVADSDVVLCAADGVAARRVTNDVARRAGKPVVLAAVFEDGAFGELIRVRRRTGCLYCLRMTQVEDGSFDAEPGLDLGYGTGTTHRPMTAAPPDLQLMGTLAAKVALSTLLEVRGRWHQRLPGDYAAVALQPKPDMPPPFDLEAAGDIRWHELPARREDCPTCARL